MSTGKPKRPRKPIYCETCQAECLQNDKTIENHVVVWCQDCGKQWLAGDDHEVSTKLPEADAKRRLELRASQIDGWRDMWRNMENDDFWMGDS